MTFLPKFFRAQELAGAVAALAAAVVGTVIFQYMLDVGSRLTA